MIQEKILVTRTSMPSYEEYIEAIKPLWDSCWLTNMGRYHSELEARLKEYLDVKKLSLMVNGHMALEMAIQAFDFKEGSEVITTPFTFVSTSHAIVRNHLKPVFCDIKLEDGCIDENKLEECITDKTVAIVPVHVYGNVCNVEAIQKIADKYGLKVIYDAAHAFGVRYNGRGIGSYGDASTFSFHATKVYNTIEGGAVAFSEEMLYEKLYNLKNFGIKSEDDVVEVGANAKMNEFSAIMGLCNLKRVDEVARARKNTYDIYVEALSGVKGIEMLQGNDAATKNYAYFPIKITEAYGMTRDELYQAFKDNDIYTRKYFYPIIPCMECYKGRYNNVNLPNAKYLAEHVLTLPFYEMLSAEKIERVINVILENK